MAFRKTGVLLGVLLICATASAKDLEFFLYEVLTPAPPLDTRSYIFGYQPIDGQQWEIGDSVETHMNINLVGISGAELVMRGGVPMDTIDVMIPPSTWDLNDWAHYMWVSDAASWPNIYPPLPGHDHDIHVEKANKKEADVTTTSTHTEETEDSDNEGDSASPQTYRKACGAIWRALYNARGIKQCGFSMRVTSKTSENDDDRYAVVATSGVRGSYYDLEFILDRYDGSLSFNVIPEPGALGLLAVAGLALLARRRR